MREIPSLGKILPLKTFPWRPLFLSENPLFRGTSAQYDTATISVYQNPSSATPILCMFLPLSETPTSQSNSTGHCDPSSQCDFSLQCGPALIGVTPLGGYHPPLRRNQACPLRRKEDLQLASEATWGPECARTISGPCALAVPDAFGSPLAPPPVRRRNSQSSPEMGDVARSRRLV